MHDCNPRLFGRGGPYAGLPSVLAQATFPHRDPGLPSGMIYTRELADGMTLTLAPTSPQYGIPFGSIPRLIVAWISAEVIRTQSKTILLGHSQREFLQMLDIDTGGRDIARFKDQALRLINCVIAVHRQMPQGQAGRRMAISASEMIFWHNNPDIPRPWISHLTLSEEFFREILNNPVKLDFGVYKSLSKSPLAMDIYTWGLWLAKSPTMQEEKQIEIPWSDITARLGTGYANTSAGLRAFRRDFANRVALILKTAFDYPIVLIETPQSKRRKSLIARWR